ncbi:hypothetical protein AAMO2058_001171700 [Amorphochlora amoebiformis]
MGNCSCSANDDPPAQFGEQKGDMEEMTTKTHMMERKKSLSSRGSKFRASKRRDSKKWKSAICAVGTEIYPNASEFPTPAAECIWTQSYPQATKTFSKEEIKSIEETFREACEEAAIAAKAAKERMNRVKSDPSGSRVTSPRQGATIGVDEFTKYFSNCFGAVGRMMSEQLFSHLTNSAERYAKGFKPEEQKPQLAIKALISAIYTWQRGTMRDRLILLFDMWDTDPTDGYLSLRELKNMVRAMSTRHAASTVMMLEALHLDISPLQQLQVDDMEEEKYANNHLAATVLERARKSAGSHEIQEIKSIMEQKRKYRVAKSAYEKKKGAQLGSPGIQAKAAEESNIKARIDDKVTDSGMSKSADSAAGDEIRFDEWEKEHDKYEKQVCSCIDNELELFVDELFESLDNEHDGLVSLEEWIRFASGDRNMDDFLEHFTLNAV